MLIILSLSSQCLLGQIFYKKLSYIDKEMETIIIDYFIFNL